MIILLRKDASLAWREPIRDGRLLDSFIHSRSFVRRKAKKDITSNPIQVFRYYCATILSVFRTTRRACCWLLIVVIVFWHACIYISKNTTASNKRTNNKHKRSPSSRAEPSRAEPTADDRDYYCWLARTIKQSMRACVLQLRMAGWLDGCVWIVRLVVVVTHTCTRTCWSSAYYCCCWSSLLFVGRSFVRSSPQSVCVMIDRERW